MCGRFTATFEFSDIRVRWNLDRDLPLYTPRFNIAPETSPNIPVIVRHGGGNECRLMRWGLIPHWAADPFHRQPHDSVSVVVAYPQGAHAQRLIAKHQLSAAQRPSFRRK